MSKIRISLCCLALCGLALAGCSQPKAAEPTAPAPAAPAAQAEPQLAAAAPPVDAREVFNSRCATCHGATGHGDGPASTALNPKPRNYTDLAWQKSVTDAQIRQTILYGGAAVGKSPIMPASPDLEGQPAVLDSLIKIVRAFGAG